MLDRSPYGKNILVEIKGKTCRKCGKLREICPFNIQNLSFQHVGPEILKIFLAVTSGVRRIMSDVSSHGMTDHSPMFSCCVGMEIQDLSTVRTFRFAVLPMGESNPMRARMSSTCLISIQYCLHVLFLISENISMSNYVCREHTHYGSVWVFCRTAGAGENYAFLLLFLLLLRLVLRLFRLYTILQRLVLALLLLLRCYC